MSSIETMFVALLDVEQFVDFLEPAARTALLNASTAIITELEITRTELSHRWGELQGLTVYEKF